MDNTYSNSRSYYSGIAIFKLIGSIMIMIFHVWTVRYQYSDYSYFVSIGQSVVPVFFFISGFLLYDSLTRRDKPIGYLKHRVRNYLIVFAIIQIPILYQYYIPQITQSGLTFYLIARYIGDVLLAFTYSQLWFIPPFIFGTIVSGLMFIHKKESKYLYPVIIFAAVAAIIYKMLPFWKELISFQNEENNEYLRLFLELPKNYLTDGVFLIYFGMYLSKQKERLSRWRIGFWIPPFLLITWLESFVYHKVLLWEPPFVGFMIYPWGLFFTVFILKIKKPNVEKYGNFINLFTILMFFLHVFEDRLLPTNLMPLFKCIIIILINIVLTYIVLISKNSLSTKKEMINNKLIRSKNQYEKL